MKKFLMRFLPIFVPIRRLRIRFRRYLKNLFFGKEYFLRSLDYKINLILQNTVDITKLKPATGTLRRCQLDTFDVFKAVANVFKKNKIPYFIEYGTLLGAVRHKGFIPWDNDIDIGILFEDVERARIALEAGLPPKYKLSNKKITKDYFKIHLKDNRKIFVDVFYAYPTKKITPKQSLELAAGFDDVFNKQLCKRDSLAANQKVLKPYLLKKADPKEYILTVTFGIFSTSREDVMPVKYSDIFPLKEIEFEGEKFYAPRNPHALLDLHYGDYMRFPPGRILSKLKPEMLKKM